MKKIHWILLVSIYVLLHSCTKVNRYYIKDVDKEMIPYQLGDTVCFFDDKGNPVTLAVTSIEDKWFIEDDAFSEQWDQVRIVDLRSEISDWGLKLQAMGGSKNYRVMNILLRPSGLIMSIAYDLAGDFLHLPEGSYSKQYAYDSLSIGSKMYHDVVESYSWNYVNPGVVPDTTRCCYSKTYGVLQVKSGGKTLLQWCP